MPSKAESSLKDIDNAQTSRPIEVSVVMPCLNEAETIETCIRKALDFFVRSQVSGEVVVADNGSTDGSIEIALRNGARVVHVEKKGYGNALMGGFQAAKGKYLIMGDADDSYDFENLMPFIEKLRAGYDVVMGNRFRGGIKKGAMSWHHKYIGNPVLTGVLNLFFRTGIGDAHCGLRGLSREAFNGLRLRTTGMEFASEMVVKAASQMLRMTEVPTVLSPDGRSRPPHLRSFRDGWRHLRFLVLLAPKWALMIPGGLMGLAGLVLMGLLWVGPLRVGHTVLDVHTMLVSSMLVIVGYQAVTIGFAARIFALQQEIGPPSRALRWGFRVLNLERGLIAGALAVIAGVALIGYVVLIWSAHGFGPLDVNRTLRPVLIGGVLIALGMQTLLMSLFYSMLGLRLRQD
ncbi:MAG: glycosyltransferase family 2 protein [Actinobacteria bacterium]|nr:MAG: glycosyltransferase family 2 protein [Actinomycetota bacterium]